VAKMKEEYGDEKDVLDMCCHSSNDIDGLWQ
jgi:hypothetical protein